MPPLYSSHHSSHDRPGFSRCAGWVGKALLGTGASLLVGGQAQAAETIQLQYYGSDPNVPSQATITLGEIRTFVQSGQLPAQVQEFLTVNRQEAGPIRQALTEEIRIPSNLQDDFTDSSVGRFVVAQIEDFIQGPEVGPNLQTAIRQSIADDRSISLLELIQNYPTPTLTLNITGLVAAYNDVSTFVARVLPALEVAREFLQDLVCDCEQPAASGTAQPDSSAQTVDSPQSTSSPQSSLTPVSTQATACSSQRLTTAKADSQTAPIQPTQTP